MAYFANDVGLYSRFTVAENLHFYANLFGGSAAKVETVLDCWQITELKNLPYGTLSAGQKAKVNIARTFLEDASILIFDEPTAFLDDAHTDLFKKALELLDPKQSVLLASHDQARLSDVSANKVTLTSEGLYAV